MVGWKKPDAEVTVKSKLSRHHKEFRQKSHKMDRQSDPGVLLSRESSLSVSDTTRMIQV